MRGIDGALSVIERSMRGAFASEALRKVWSEIDPPEERSLAASLTYITLRKLGLWRHLVNRYCKRPPHSMTDLTKRVLVTAAAGIMGLRSFSPEPLVNAMVQIVKDDPAASGEAGLVNAVLRTMMRDGALYLHDLERSTDLKDTALLHGTPAWAAAMMASEMGMSEARRVIRCMDTDAYASLRCLSSYAETASASLPDSEIVEIGHGAVSIRMRKTAHPYDIPGYAAGDAVLMSESSMCAVDAVLSQAESLKRSLARPVRLLDMCMGRAVKAAQILKSDGDISLCGWEISPRRVDAARRELRRVGVDARAEVSVGDALGLQPADVPDIILIDAPCSGSGTWRRHPEAKWRLTQKNIADSSMLQSRLFSRAADIAASGGAIIYCTCSIFRSENEIAVGRVLASRSDLVEIPIHKIEGRGIKKGRPYGSVMLPDDPWQDGFYIAVFKKKV